MNESDTAGAATEAWADFKARYPMNASRDNAEFVFRMAFLDGVAHGSWRQCEKLRVDHADPGPCDVEAATRAPARAGI